MKKHEIISFKVDEKLFDAIKDLPNRSEFIRAAIISAMGSTCPLCNGTGMLSSKQKMHWDEFTTGHPIETCGDCHERYLVCSRAQV